VTTDPRSRAVELLPWIAGLLVALIVTIAVVAVPASSLQMAGPYVAVALAGLAVWRYGGSPWPLLAVPIAWMVIPLLESVRHLAFVDFGAGAAIGVSLILMTLTASVTLLRYAPEERRAQCAVLVTAAAGGLLALALWWSNLAIVGIGETLAALASVIAAELVLAVVPLTTGLAAVLGGRRLLVLVRGTA